MNLNPSFQIEIKIEAYERGFIQQKGISFSECCFMTIRYLTDNI